MDLLQRLYEMTAIQDLVSNPQILLMILIAFFLLYLGIKKQYEPLLLVPIAFGMLLAPATRVHIAFLCRDTAKRKLSKS